MLRLPLLRSPQARVLTLRIPEQLRVGALLNDATGLKDDDVVGGRRHRRQPVHDREQRA